MIVAARIAALPGWSRADKAIRKQFTFRDFPEAVLFVSALVPAAEAADHHPDIDIRYVKVTMSLSTHDAGGITQHDLDLAQKIETAARASD